jgi:hypothetical protein
MRDGALPGWNVPGRCARSDAKPPVRRPLQMEQTMREWPLRGSSERQALSLRALHEDQGAYESGIAFCRPPQGEGARDGSATRAAPATTTCAGGGGGSSRQRTGRRAGQRAARGVAGMRACQDVR